MSPANHNLFIFAMGKNLVLSALLFLQSCSLVAFSGDTAIISAKYRRWLDQEVVYIISDNERKEFLALKSDAERESFIEKFWSLRDSDPSTEESEYRREHYERIRYANEKFFDGVEGWRTERGRIYIMRGPPDSISFTFGGNPLYINIESPTPVISGDTNPDRRKNYRLSFTTPETEIWVYHRLEGAENVSGYFEVMFSRVDVTQLYQLNQVLRHLGGKSYGQRLERDYAIMNFLRGQRIGGPYRILYAGEYKFQDIDGFYDSAFHPDKLPTLGVLDFQMGLQDLEKSPGELLEKKLALSRQLKERVKSRIFYQTLQLDVRFGSVRAEKGATLLPLTIGFGPGSADDTADLLIELTRLDGKNAASLVDSIKIGARPAGLGPAPAEFLYQARLIARPGPCKLFVYASMRKKRAAAQFSQEIDLPDYSGKELAMSDLLLFQNVIPRNEFAREASVAASVPKFVGGAPVRLKDYVLVPASSPRFRRRENLTAFFEVYNPGLSGRQPDIQVKCKFWKDGQLLVSLPDKMLNYVTETKEEDRHQMSTAYGLTIPLRTFHPGEYSLELEIFDRVQNRNIARQTAFTVY